MTDAERESAVNFIAANPDTGEIIPGTGGCRKVRIAREGKGKSGGYRLITYYGSSDQPAFLLTVISKGKQTNLTERSEEHTSELQSLMRISYAVFCLKKKKKHQN